MKKKSQKQKKAEASKPNAEFDPKAIAKDLKREALAAQKRIKDAAKKR
jgi:hypothetical protein